MANSHHTKIQFTQVATDVAQAKTLAVLRIVAGALERVRAEKKRKTESKAA